VGTPPLFDSHLHLTSARFDEDRHETLERARHAGVTELVTVATDPEDARRAIRLAEEEDGVWATAGLHPHEAAGFNEDALREIEEMADSGSVVALGETGLDYHYDHAPRDLQLANFRAHMELAERTGLPVIVHSREADADTARIVAEFEGRATGVLHCFTAGEELLQVGLAAGWLVSFSGIVSFASELAPLVRAVPDERLLIETDSPYLAPVPKRGRRNEPAFLAHTCEAVARLREAGVDDTARLTTANARRFYGVQQEPDRRER
jgi:TatD DNase family protein